MLNHVILGIIFPSLPSIDTRITRETAHIKPLLQAIHNEARKLSLRSNFWCF